MDSTFDLQETLELPPKYAQIENLDELFFQKGSSWAEKGGKLLSKRSLNVFQLLLIALSPKTAEEIQNITNFITREKQRELYLYPLCQEGFLEYTIKDKPNSPDQRYITTEKGRRFLGEFDI